MKCNFTKFFTLVYWSFSKLLSFLKYDNTFSVNAYADISYFSWVCDDEPDCGSTLQGTLDISDEDPVRCRGNVSCLGNQFLCKVWIEHILTNHILELFHRKVDVLQNQCWLIKLAALQLFLKLLLTLWHNFVLLASEFCRHNTAVADFAKNYYKTYYVLL